VGIDHLENLFVNVATALSECLVECSKYVLDLFTEVTLIAYLNIDSFKLLHEEISNAFSIS